MSVLIFFGVLTLILLIVIILLYLEARSLQRKLAAKDAEIQTTLQNATRTINDAMAMRDEAQKMKEELDKRIEEARKESVQKSREVVVGKISEQLAPFFPNFKYNPKDVRFIGTPIDLIVFNGLDSGRIDSIVFIEVKTGNARMTDREKSVMDAINASKVSFEILRIDSAIDQVE
ncbi:Holliday junction resolvase-like protein [Thermoplasma sp.]|uniref:Holliday junction resolvase-like protein n=1 Tax=Thermoplasma sp. TaxID=1973142 RepID=UPI00127FC841|nr:Holliday junction resolvase-like protein [Thermoplasma sp.]KAA8922452.1 MAG: endonuclease [Thermoplasma sp.]